tara:strand:+ start:2355 stop:3602 length:1248 start_codon:yes stop_codon:yes gene_type:complete
MAETKKPGKVRAAIIDWLGKPLGLSTKDFAFWQDYYGKSSSGKNVTVDSSLQLSTVWACVRLLSETISTLPLKLYERQSDGSRVRAERHPLYNVLTRSPNAEMTQSRFIAFIVSSIALRGCAFIEKKRIGNKIVALEPLLPQNMVVDRKKNGQLEYRYTEDGEKRILSEREVMHIRGFGIDGVTGMMPVAAGADVFGAAMAADEAAGKVFANGMQASGFLTHEGGVLKENQREQIRESLNKFSGSQNAGKLMVLEAGMKYQGITMDPEAAQMLETRAFNVEEICRWFRVPPFMVGHMDKQSSWAASVEAQNLHFLSNSLRPLLVNIEQEISRCLLTPNERDKYFAEFNVEGLLRADSAARANFYNTALQNGWLNRNEVRQKENMPPVDGGETYTAQSNLLPLEKLGQDSGNGANS